MNLNAFLSQNVKKVNEIEFVVSDRFKDEKGKPVPFVLAPINAKKDEQLKNECTKQFIDKKTGRPDVKFDSVKYGRRMTIETVKFPNLHSQELQDSYGVMGADDLLTVMLLPGEYVKLQNKVQEVNGFKSFTELEEEAKN